MKQCIKCGKSGLFLKLDDNLLCKECAEAIAAAAVAERQAKIDEASAFIHAYGKHVGAAFATSYFRSNMEKEEIERIIQECDFVLAHSDDWKSYELFRMAFDKMLQKDGSIGGRSPLWPGHWMSIRQDGYIEKLFDDIRAKANETRSKAVSAKLKIRTYTRVFKVVGVTFKNGRRSRQTILRQIHFEDPPYKGNFEITLKKQDFEGEDAIAVYAINEQVGFISREDLPWLLEQWSEYR